MTDSKTATECLRKMLDARGVEWESKDVEGIKGFHDTRWQAMGVQWCYVEFVDNNYTKLMPSKEFHCTPEQAIAATLGSEREKELETLVKQLWYLVNHRSGYGYAAALEAIEELGIEVIDE